MRFLDMPVQICLPLCAMCSDLAVAAGVFPGAKVPRRIGIVHLFDVLVQAALEFKCSGTLVYRALVWPRVLLEMLADEVRQCQSLNPRVGIFQDAYFRSRGRSNVSKQYWQEMGLGGRGPESSRLLFSCGG